MWGVWCVGAGGVFVVFGVWGAFVGFGVFCVLGLFGVLGLFVVLGAVGVFVRSASLGTDALGTCFNLRLILLSARVRSDAPGA